MRSVNAQLAALAAATFLLHGCAKAPVIEPPPPPPPPVVLDVVVTAQAGLNPDPGGRPSPVVLRIYQLTDAAAFTGADFFALWEHEAETLTASLARRQELVIAPGGRASERLQLEPGVRGVGVAAAFRDIRDARWRSVVDAPAPGTAGQGPTRLEIVLDAKSVTARLAAPPSPAGAAP